ncbi:Glutamate receptor 1 [Temnothorax longispinosus]|uniref:Glutamate receptor 1 n=1 Tax=Temnothorax longispinosus TaxID=300112 RepID=A0A4S2KIV0_9HYME|nr:Glutamate receptor 1 [Temnothorax longispinosus]
MRLSLCSACPMLLFVLLDTSARNIYFNVNVFVDVILSVRRQYTAAPVIFTHPGDQYGDYGDLQITHLIHESSRLLSRHYIMTADMHFKMLRTSLRYYRQVVHPIIVVILPDFEAYLDFAEATKTYPMSFPVWFMLFLYTPDNGTHDYCHEPVSNPLNLAFDTQMLVLCNNDSVLREWYSVNGETVKIFDLAEWGDDENKFIALTNLSLYERRKDMEGVVLRAVTVKDTSVMTKFAGNYVASMYGKILEELTYSLNFTLKIVSQMSEHGLWDEQNQAWSGVMGEIVAGRADFAIADMSMTSFRVRFVDFTLPLIISRNTLYFKEPGICGVKWLGYFQLCEKNKLAFYTTEVFKEAINIYIRCSIVYIETGRIDNLAMTLTKGNPYTGFMNYHLRKLHLNGVIHKLKNKYYIRSNYPREVTYYGLVELSDVTPTLTMVAAKQKET